MVRPAEWLIGGGETGDLIRSRDWSTTPFGPRDNWPATLRTVVNLIVGTRFPMALLWGNEALLLYNDGYREIAGERHPEALGSSSREVWPEVWHINAPILDAVMARGETRYLENKLFLIDRHGHREEAWFTLCYSPVREEDGAVAGTLVTLLETTGQVQQQRALERERSRAEAEAVHEREALRALESRYQTLFENVDIGFCVIEVLLDETGKGVDHRFLETNPAFERHSGLQDAQGRTAREMVPNLEARWPERYGRVATSRQPERFEMESPAMGRWFEVYAFPTGLPEEHRVGLIFTDISERRRAGLERDRAEEALKRSAREYRSLAEHSPEVIARFDRRLAHTYVNAYGAQVYGLPASEVIGKTNEELGMPPDKVAFWKARFEEVFATGEQRTVDFDFDSPTFGHQHFSSLFVPELNQRGEVSSILAITRDITNLRRAESALRESEERHRAILDNMSEGLMLFDAQGNLVYQNPASLGIHGFDRGQDGRITQEKLPTTWEAWDDKERPITFEEWPVSRVFRNEQFKNQILHVRRAETGFEFYASYNGSPLKDAEGRVVGGFITIRDITEELQAERALRAANERLIETDLRKNEFLAVLSHELRNPLSPIRNSVYVMERATPGSVQSRRALTIIDRQVTQMARLIDDLLDVTRISRGKIRLQRETVELNEIVRGTAEDMRALFQLNQIDFTVSIPEQRLRAIADRTRVAQVVGNLLANAIKFTPPGGTVALSLELGEPGQAVIRVRDSGVGIETPLFQKLFEPFVQADNTLERTKGGLGLGLALVKALVELHGGEVQAHSEGPGSGAEFTVRLPLENGEQRDSQGARDSSVTSSGTTLRVLLIEDNADAAESLKVALELDGHEIAVAANGLEGIQKARAFRPDVVLCDIGLPGIDGFEVARRMRADPLLERTCLVALSGYAGPEDVARSKQAGFLKHLAKPPKVEELQEVMMELYGESCAGLSASPRSRA